MEGGSGCHPFFEFQLLLGVKYQHLIFLVAVRLTFRAYFETSTVMVSYDDYEI